MGMFPISMSLIARYKFKIFYLFIFVKIIPPLKVKLVSCSYISGISLLGLPAEMYTYGTQLWAAVLSEWAVSLTIAVIYLPVFYNLQITSTYEVI